MRPHRFGGVVAVVVVAALSGCSSEAEPSPAAQPPPAAEATVASAGPAAADDCGDVADLIRDHVGAEKVEKVTVVGQCTTVVIDTNLSDSEADRAVALCNSAAEVAYVDDINSIRVLNAAGDELAQGITDLKCLP